MLFSRQFFPIFLTQALSALLDNLYRNAAVLLIAFRDPVHGASLVPLAGLLFTLPFALGSAPAGTIADSFDKAVLIRANRVTEFCLSIAGAAALIWGGAGIMLGVLFGFGVQACFFGPLKFAILPQLVPAGSLMRANGWVAASTFIAILLGTIIGGALIALPGGTLWAGGVCIATSAVGLIAARFVPSAPAHARMKIDWNIWRATGQQLRAVLGDAALRGPALGVSWFWVLGSVMLAEIPLIAARTLRADTTVATVLLACFPVGLGLGAMLAGRARRPLRLLAGAALAVSALLIDFAIEAPAMQGRWGDAGAMLADWQGLHLLADLMLAAIAAGAFVVPLNAALQSRARADRRARTVAANNVLNAIAIVGAGIVAATLPLLGASPPAIIGLLALANLAAAWGWRAAAD